MAVTRLANLYGPGDLNWSRIIPDSARALARGERPVIRSDGTPERDYLYVEDAVDAYLAIAASLDKPELHGRAWNAGLRQADPGDRRGAHADLGVRQRRRAGRAGEGTPHGEIDRQYLDSTAIREELGWAPQWDLERGLAVTWAWYRQQVERA